MSQSLKDRTWLKSLAKALFQLFALTPGAPVTFDANGRLVDGEAGGGLGYLVYTALLSQSGANAPVATVLENTLGGPVVWTYTNTGVYTATLIGAFVDNKTFLLINAVPDVEGQVLVSAFRLSDDAVMVVSGSDGSTTDGVLGGTSIEIRVYP